MNSQLSRRKFLRIAAGAAAFPGAFTYAQATAAKIVVGFPPGGTADVLARVLTPLLSPIVGSPVIVENKSGASGQLAATAVRQASSTEMNFLLTPSSVLALTPHLYKKPLFDSMRDFKPVASVCDHSFALAVPGSSSVRTVAEFVAWAKKKASPVSFASPGAGSSPHFLGIMFGRASGVDMSHIAYRGVGPGLQDLAGGQVDATVNPSPTMLEFHRAGRIRILAVTSAKRLATLPDVPTFAELGMKDLNYSEWYGLFASSQLPDPVVQRWEGAVRFAVGSDKMKDAARQLEVEPLARTSVQLRKMLEADSNRWAGVVKATGIQLES